MTLANTQVSTGVKSSIASTSGAAAITVAITDAVSSNYPAGNAAGQADVAYSRQRSVTAGTPDVIDLSALTDNFGAAITLVHVEAIVLTNLSTTAGQDLTVGGGSNQLSSSFGGFMQAGNSTSNLPGGRLIMENRAIGITVDSTHKTIQVVAASGTVNYTLTILGRSA